MHGAKTLLSSFVVWTRKEAVNGHETEQVRKDLASETSLAGEIGYKNLVHRSNVSELQMMFPAMSIKVKSPVNPFSAYQTKLILPPLNLSLSNILKLKEI